MSQATQNLEKMACKENATTCISNVRRRGTRAGRSEHSESASVEADVNSESCNGTKRKQRSPGTRKRRKERCQDSLHQVNQPRAANKQREDELQEWLNKYMLEATEDLRRDMEVMRKDMEVMHRNMDSSFEDMKTALGEYQDGVSETRCELRDIQDELEDFQDKLRAIQDETKDCEDMLESVQSELKVVNAGIERVEHGLNGVQNDLKVANDNMELVKEGTKELVKAEERNFKIQQMKNMEMAVGLAELADRLGIDTSVRTRP